MTPTLSPTPDQVQVAQRQLAHLTQQQTHQQQRQAQLMKQLQNTQQELAQLIGQQNTQPGAGALSAAAAAAAAGFRPISQGEELTTARVLPGALVRMLTAAVPPHAILSGTRAWFELFELTIEDLHRDSSKPLTVVSLFGPETDIEEGARVLAAAASQSATRSNRVVAYTQRRKLPLTLAIELQPLFNTTNVVPLLIWTFDAIDEATAATAAAAAAASAAAASAAAAPTERVAGLGAAKRPRSPQERAGGSVERSLELSPTPLTSDVLQGCFDSGVGPSMGANGHLGDSSLLSIAQMAASQRVYPCASALLSGRPGGSEGPISMACQPRILDAAGRDGICSLSPASAGMTLTAGDCARLSAAALLSGRTEGVAGMTAMGVRSQEGSPAGHARSAGRGYAKNPVYMTNLADLDTGSGKPRPQGRLGSGSNGSGSNPSDSPEFLSNVLIDAFLDDFNSIHNEL